MFTKGWVVHEHIGGESCSVLQQELSYVLITCNTKLTSHTPADKASMLHTHRHTAVQFTCLCCGVQRQPVDDSKVITVNGTVPDVSVIAVDQEPDHIHVTLLA